LTRERPFTFECSRCGVCCTNIRGRNFGKCLGLTLLPVEIGLFPRELIKPLYRYAANDPIPADRLRVWMYQLDVDVCPHYGGERGCIIYDKRPSACGAYPFEYTRGGKIVVHRGTCPEAKKMTFQDGDMIRLPGLYVRPALRVHEWYRHHLNDNPHQPFDVYDLGAQAWVGILEGITEEDEAFIRRLK